MRKTIFSLVAVTVGLSATGSPVQARKAMSEETQRRALLGQLAAASAEVAPEERTDAVQGVSVGNNYAAYINQATLSNSSHGLCAILLAASEMEAQ